eukprot:gene24152-32569_t
MIPHHLCSDVENEFIPPIAVGGILQHLLNSEVKKLQENFPTLNSHNHHDILTESRRVSPYSLLSQYIAKQETNSTTNTTSSLYIDCPTSNGANSDFVVSFDELNSRNVANRPKSSNVNEMLCRSTKSFPSSYQYLVMNSDGTIGAAESISYTSSTQLNGESVAAPVVIDVVSWHELCERLGPHPLDPNTCAWIRQLLGTSTTQLYESVHKNILPLSKNSEPNLLEHEDDADRWDKLAERALKMKVYGRNVQLNSSLYSEVISNSVATMAMGLQTSESNTSEVIKVLLLRKDLIPTLKEGTENGEGGDQNDEVAGSENGGLEQMEASNAEEGGEESGSVNKDESGKNTGNVKKKRFRKSKACKRSTPRMRKAVEQVEDAATQAFRDLLSEPAFRSDACALGDVLLSRRTRRVKRHALLLAQSDYCDSQRIVGTMTKKIRAKEQVGLVDMLPSCYEEDFINHCSSSHSPSPSSPSHHPGQYHYGIHSAGPSDAELFHSHQRFRSILLDNPNPNSNQDSNKKSSISWEEDLQKIYPDSFSNRVNLYGSYLKSEDLDVIDDDSFSHPATPCLQLLEYIQYIANTKFASRVTRKDECSDHSRQSSASNAPQPCHSNSNDKDTNWEVLNELFDPSALIAIAVVVEEMCKEMMLEWYNRGTIVGHNGRDSLRVELSAQLNSKGPSTASSLSPPSSLEMVYGLAKAIFGTAVVKDKDVQREVESIHREFYSNDDQS